MFTEVFDTSILVDEAAVSLGGKVDGGGGGGGGSIEAEAVLPTKLPSSSCMPTVLVRHALLTNWA